MITVLLTIVHVVVCLFLIVVILLQSGKAADLAGAFGGMGSQTAFGPRGSATLLSKATTISTVVFMLTSITLSILATKGAGVSGTALERHGAPKNSAPAQTSAPAQAPSTTTIPFGGLPAGTPAAPAAAASVTTAPAAATPAAPAPAKK